MVCEKRNKAEKLITGGDEEKHTSLIKKPDNVEVSRDFFNTMALLFLFLLFHY